MFGMFNVAASSMIAALVDDVPAMTAWKAPTYAGQRPFLDGREAVSAALARTIKKALASLTRCKKKD